MPEEGAGKGKGEGEASGPDGPPAGLPQDQPAGSEDPDRLALMTRAADLAARLLAWYDREGRDLPWRVKGGASADPYRVWLSEVMLQQTTVPAATGYYRAFLERWPTVQDLAAADLDSVLAAWAGLGYYARARNLHACARHIADWREGHFPDTEEALRDLPGIGRYTAAAIAAICFGRRAVVVDGNVERVMARLFAEPDPVPGVKKTLFARADSLTPTERCADYAQAVMDLGATLCSPRRPACGLCPWQADCLGRRRGVAADLPARPPRPDKPRRYGIAFWLTEAEDCVLLRRRPETGLLGGMMEVPSTLWRETPWDPEAEAAAIAAAAPLPVAWRPVTGRVSHTFTHFHLELAVLVGRVERRRPPVRGVWVPITDLGSQALPTVMTKLVRLALTGRG